MPDTVNYCNPAIYFHYANTQKDIWLKLIDKRIIHNTFGEGKIVDIHISEPLINSIVHVEFSSDYDNSNQKGKLRKLGLFAFQNQIFTQVELPANLIDSFNKYELEYKQKLLLNEEREKEREEEEKRWAVYKHELEEKRKLQKKKEREAFEEFAYLKSKYQVSSYKETSPISLLFEILKRIDDNEIMNDDQIGWLEKNHLNPVLGIYYERIAQEEGLWCLTKAGKYWRRAANPARALRITENVHSDDARTNSAILTMRGGAFRDIKNYPEAEKCGLEAIELFPKSPHPYNLLCAIYYQTGKPEKGDDYFNKAKARGETNDEKKFIENSLRAADLNDRKITARYLLRKDPQKYKWAEFYL